MTPKEKALELYKNIFKITESQYESKQCALIAVDEIIKQENMIVPKLMKIIKLLYINKFDNYEYKNDINAYWQEVKTEVEKL
jgi:hypothetical protein